MNREELVSLCEVFATRRGLVHGRVRIGADASVSDPVPEILRSFRLAEISESEKNALIALVSDADGDEEGDEDGCIRELAAEQAVTGDDD
ncbi:MAG: hypothetical protein ACKO4T_00675 [Planctomycetaceae bacterium]